MSFKTFLMEDLALKAPKPNNKISFSINLKEYREILQKSTLKNRKIVLKRVNEGKGEVPVFCEELKKFFMLNLSDKKLRLRELKSREDKEFSGILLNSLIVNEITKNNQEKCVQLIEMKLNWEAPRIVYTVKDEFGKDIYLKD